MTDENNCKLVFEDGTELVGTWIGEHQPRVCEIVFNTSMVGYQEIISDPSYTYQAVVMTYPLIGNYGIAVDDYETITPTIGALIVGECDNAPSNWRCETTVDQVLKKYGIPGICDIDTRRLTRRIRDIGSTKVLLTHADKSKEECLSTLCETDIKTNAVDLVSTKEIVEFMPTISKMSKIRAIPEMPANKHVVIIDCGLKKSIASALVERGCKVTLVPYNTTAEVIESLNPDGILISNGPGDPTDVPEVAETLKKLRGRHPIFGICLGHQLLALSYGATCFKLKFGHRGGNHPVKELKSGRIVMTSQNHSYAVDSASLLTTNLQTTHVNLLDGTVEGICSKKDGAFSVQYHPEGAPGPEDSQYLFDRFIEMMEVEKNA